MKKLQNIILDRIDDESLEELNKQYPSLRIDEEWSRRLLSCNIETYLPTLEILEKKKIKSKTLKKTLYEMRKCFPWRIGVVYDFRTGHIKSLEVRLGMSNSKYQYQGSPIVFTWLDVNESKKLIREVISSNAQASLFSVKLEDEKSEKVRDLLLDNKTVDIDVIIMQATNKAFNTFPTDNPLSGGEDFVVYPSKISKNDLSINLFPVQNHQVFSYKSIPIKFSPDVIKYLSVISM